MTLSNNRDGFEATRQAILDLLAPHQPSAKLLFGVELILEETLMNVIWHAYGDQAEHAIELDVQVEPEDIVMSFEDDGIAFDPLQAVEPVLPKSLEDAIPGGLGLMLVRKYARSIAYQRINDRNHLTLRVARH
ncbi:MAG: ATP-binding protein [Burkholderiaceae bacterium]|nr:ATP-binding protein [Burkholderiaceae bacterium]